MAVNFQMITHFSAIILLALLLTLHPIVVKSWMCDPNYPSSIVQSVQGISDEAVANLQSLDDGFAAQTRIMSIYFLPRSHNEATEKKLRHMMKQLAILSEQEQRLAALLTLTGTQDDPGMIALRVIFKQLVQNTCDLFTEIYHTECSYIELKKLKLKLEAFDAAITSGAAVRAARASLSGSTATTIPSGIVQWINNRLACSFSAEEIDLLTSNTSWTISTRCCQ